MTLYKGSFGLAKNELAWLSQTSILVGGTDSLRVESCSLCLGAITGDTTIAPNVDTTSPKLGPGRKGNWPSRLIKCLSS